MAMKEEFIIKKRKTKLVITMGPALQDGGLPAGSSETCRRSPAQRQPQQTRGTNAGPETHKKNFG